MGGRYAARRTTNHITPIIIPDDTLAEGPARSKWAATPAFGRSSRIDDHDAASGSVLG